MSTVPSLALVRSEAIRSRVLLPQPEGPITLTNSPASTRRSTPSSAVVPSGKRLLTPAKVSSGAASDAIGESSSGLDSAKLGPPRLRRPRCCIADPSAHLRHLCNLGLLAQ